VFSATVVLRHLLSIPSKRSCFIVSCSVLSMWALPAHGVEQAHIENYDYNVKTGSRRFGG
jgi:hypothetical protein